jgi:hypothetical protein
MRPHVLTTHSRTLAALAVGVLVGSLTAGGLAMADSS